jgi:hypothetical protein
MLLGLYVINVSPGTEKKYRDHLSFPERIGWIKESRGYGKIAIKIQTIAKGLQM